MDGRQPDDALNDTALEREIELALAVDPSPEFLARVRARVAAEPASSAWRFGWSWLGAAAAAATIVAAIVLFRSNAPLLPADAGAVPLTATSTATPAPVPVPAVSRPSRERVPHPRVRPSLPPGSGARRAPPAEPEVLVSKEEAATLKHLMRGLRRGVVESSISGEGQAGIQAIQPLNPVVVVPIPALSPVSIDPLGSLALEVGVQQ